MRNIILYFLFIVCLNNIGRSQAIFLSFQTQTYTDTIEVSWITQSETNVDYFILQRAFAGSGIFSNIDTVTAVGNSTTNQSYIYNDRPPIIDTCCLYRLKVVELNGQFAFSSVVMGCVFIPNAIIEFGNEITTNIYPNPSSGCFEVTCNKLIKNGNIMVFNSAGENIYTREITKELAFEINIKNISPGIYFLKVSDGNKNYCRKIMIQKD